MKSKSRMLMILVGVFIISALIFHGFNAYAEEKPLRIGFSVPLTGGVAEAGKAALLAYQICAADYNAKGGVLGRKIELVYYDDHSKPADVPAIYTKLISVDKVDFVVGPHGTGQVAASLPVVAENKMFFPAGFALLANRKLKYDRYFQFEPHGEEAVKYLYWGFFDVAAKQQPKPQTISLFAVDNEAGAQGIEHAKKMADEFGFKVLYTGKYPPETVDFSPMARAIKAANADLVWLMTYPTGTVGFIHAAKEIDLKPKMIGGPMVGAAYGAIQTTLGKDLEGFLSFTWWVPEPTMNFPGINDFLKKYQAKAPELGVDPLGYYQPPYAYAMMQFLFNSIIATKSFDQGVLAEYGRKNKHNTIVGEIEFGPYGEWKESRTIYIQFQNIKGNKPEDFAGPGHLIIVSPEKYVSGKLVYPFKGWQK